MSTDNISNWIVEKPDWATSGMWVKVIAHIKKVETGEIVSRDIHLPWEDYVEWGGKKVGGGAGYVNDFLWSEGNYSCDCNRKIEFNDEYDGWSDEPCTDGNYLANLENPKDNKVFYREFE